jgi:hypothetical protein
MWLQLQTRFAKIARERSISTCVHVYPSSESNSAADDAVAALSGFGRSAVPIIPSTVAPSIQA